MANPSFNLNLTVVSTCETDAANWTINAGPDADTETYKQGTQSYSGIITRTNNGTVTYTPGTAISNASFFASGSHMRAWIQYTFTNNLAVKNDANGGGIQFWASDGTNTAYWNVEGRDTYAGGWALMQANLNANPDSGTKPTGAISTLGVKLNLDVSAKNVNNFWIDHLVYGSGYEIYGGTTGDRITWDTLASTDAAAGYGLVVKERGVFFVNGELKIGDSVGTNACWFDGTDAQVVFYENNQSSNLYALDGTGNSTNPANIDLSGSVISSSATDKVQFNMAPANSINFTAEGMTLKNARSVKFKTSSTVTGCVFDNCLQIDYGAGTFTGNTIKNYGGTDGAILYQNNATLCKDNIFLDNTRAVEVTSTSNQTFDNMTFDGNTYDVHLDNGGTSIEISKNNGSNPSTYIATGGGTVTFVGASTSITVKAVDTTGANISGARVFLRTGAAGSLPYNASVTISNSGTTATVTHTAHGMKTGDKVVIEGVTNNENRGTKTITVTGVNTYTYTTTSLTASDSGNAYFVFVEGTTDVNGEISASRVYPANQAATGRVRKSSGAPYYKSSPLTGTVSATVDVTLTAVMISDD